MSRPYHPPPPGFGQTSGLSRTESARVNTPAVVLAAVAAVLAVLSVTVLGWFRDPDVHLNVTDTARSSFADIRHLFALADAYRAGSGLHFNQFAAVYFGWLGYVLIGAAVLLALASAVPGRAATPISVLAVLVSIAGLAATLTALALFRVDPSDIDVLRGSEPRTSWLDWLEHTGAGAWAILAAYLACAVAAGLPTRRVR